MRPTLMRHTSSLKVFEMPIAGEVARERLLVTVAAWRGAGALGGAGAHTELGDVPIRLRKVWNDDLAHRDPALKPLKATTHADPGLRKVWNDDLAHRDPALKPLRAITHADPGLRELVGGGRMDYHGAEPPFPAPTLAPRSQNRSPVHSLTTLPHHGPRASSRAGAIGCAPRAHFLARSSSRASGRGREGGGVAAAAAWHRRRATKSHTRSAPLLHGLERVVKPSYRVAVAVDRRRENDRQPALPYQPHGRRLALSLQSQLCDLSVRDTVAS